MITTIAFTLPLLTSSVEAASTTAITVGGNDICQLDWTEVNIADPTGWNFTGNLGDRNDLSRLYHHTPSGLYIKISVAQRWNWNGKKAAPSLGLPEMPDNNRFVPKITDYSHYGTGGYQVGEHLFAMGLNTTAHDLSVEDGKNTMTIEFFNDAALTSKAEVDTLNFVTTDIDSSAGNTEQIIVDVEDIAGNSPYIHFDRPTTTAITDSLIDFTNNTVTGVGTEITNSTGNIAPVVVGNTHKLSLTYQLITNPTAPSNSAVNRYTYISNLSWCRTSSHFPPEDPTNPSTKPPVDLMFKD